MYTRSSGKTADAMVADAFRRLSRSRVLTWADTKSDDSCRHKTGGQSSRVVSCHALPTHGMVYELVPICYLIWGNPFIPIRLGVSDITYLPLVGGGWAYLASWLDLFSRRIVGWCVDSTMEESLIIRAFDQATTLRRPQPSLIIHSDQGGQYFGKIFRKRLNKWKCAQSMAEKENPYQNAHAESLWSRLKAELLEDGCFETLQDAHDELFNYIEGYYNISRLHSSLGYMSPINFERQYHQANFTHNSQSQVSG